MVDLNIPNFITIGLISIVGYASLKFVLERAGYSTNWL